jgi:hypothetical protein
MTLILGIVTKILIGDDNLMTVFFVVGEFVDSIHDAVGFHDDKKWEVRATDLQQSGLAEPIARIQYGHVLELVTV